MILSSIQQSSIDFKALIKIINLIKRYTDNYFNKKIYRQIFYLNKF